MVAIDFCDFIQQVLDRLQLVCVITVEKMDSVYWLRNPFAELWENKVLVLLAILLGIVITADNIDNISPCGNMERYIS